MTGSDVTERPAPARAVFGRRKGKKMRGRQSALLATRLPTLAIDLSRGTIDRPNLFGRSEGRLEVEIGFGGGEHLTSAAARAPETGFLGCEPFINGVAKALTRIESLGLANVRLHAGDGMDLLAALPVASIDRLYLLYPDPWPKRRHRKRRFVNDRTLALLARALKPGAEFRFATDIDDYAAWTLAHVARCPLFEWRAQQKGDWLEPWPDWPGTRYESKARAQGRRPIYLTFARSAFAP